MHAGIYLATDYLVYPTKCELLGADGLLASVRATQEANAYRVDLGFAQIQIMGIVPNMVRSTTIEHQENLVQLRQRFGDLLWTEVPIMTLIPEAAKQRKAVWVHAPSSQAAKVLWEIADRALEVVYGSPSTS